MVSVCGMVVVIVLLIRMFKGIDRKVSIVSVILCFLILWLRYLGVWFIISLVRKMVRMI